MSHFIPNLQDFAFYEEVIKEEEKLLSEAEAVSKGIIDFFLPSHMSWNHDYVSPLAMAETVPLKHYPKLKWGLDVADQVLKLLRNDHHLKADKETVGEFSAKHQQLEEEVSRGVLSFETLNSIVSDLAVHGVVSPDHETKSLEDYQALFQTIGIPPVYKYYAQDDHFANMRVAGPNPLLIKRIAKMPKKFPLTEKQYRSVVSDDSLEDALASGRIYICDYQLLSLQEESSELPKKFLYSPIALFVENKKTRKLIPVAIQCKQYPAIDNPIYLADGSYDWLIAKTIVETADGNYHEMVSHLGRTHLYIEPFIVATLRNLKDKHPVRKLLMPHFEGNLFINHLALKTLVAPDGPVEKLLSGTLPSDIRLAVQGVLSYPFNDAMLPTSFKQRDVNDLHHYPYRDDANLYWNAIHEWVSGYLQQTYTHLNNVSSDAKLQKWCDDLTSHQGGRVKGFGQELNRIQTKEYLANALTMVIFTSSVQHAAVNFPQWSLMSYSPNMPLASFGSLPKSADEGNYLQMLPPIAHAKTQLDVMFTLGTVYYTKLGNYRSHTFNKSVTNKSLREFQQELNEIDTKISNRNKLRKYPYNTLLSNAIPQSINI